jgi:two-component system response regulator RegX3
MQGNILIIEDIKEMADLIALYLSREGYETRAVESAEDAFTVIENWKPELIILDLNLPGMDGFTFLTQYRKTSDSPVLIVSARDSDEDQINGLEIGADEYITKPFSPKVLVARVNVLFRRFRGLIEKNQKNIFRFGPYVLDYDSCILKKDGKRIPLSTNEYNCLTWLTEHPGSPMPVDTIYSGVWKNKFGDITTVAVYIQRLRKKIEEDPSNPVYIETVHGRGYQFNITSPRLLTP